MNIWKLGISHEANRPIISYAKTHKVFDSYILFEKLLQDLLQPTEKEMNQNLKLINSKAMVWKNW